MTDMTYTALVRGFSHQVRMYSGVGEEQMIAAVREYFAFPGTSDEWEDFIRARAETVTTGRE